jgi:predicted small lipoprotein YifL
VHDAENSAKDMPQKTGIPMSVRKFAVLLVLLVSAGSVLSGCGRRGDPISPSEAARDMRAERQKAGGTVPVEPEKPAEDRPFILDGLL